MRKRWLLHGIVAFSAVVAGAQSIHAQGGGGGGGGGGGASGGLSSSGGLSTSTGTTGGSSGSGIATLGSGSTGGGSGKSSTAGTTIPATSDPISATYQNPLAIATSGVNQSFSYNSSGMVSQIGASTGFGVPTFAAATAPNTGSTIKNTNGTNGTGFNTLSIPKTPSFVTVLAKSVPYVQHNSNKLQETLLAGLAQAPFMNGKKGIFLAVDGSTVFLKGDVADPQERRVIEGFVRMTPGVRNVVNDLVPLSKE